jgi:putative Ca2+/H+ antiporter (TMEM165/GDT1 family)
MSARPRWCPMEALFVSTAVVAVAEIGDKTQLLALVLAARFRKPVPIILGILIATIANHALAAWVGAAVASWLGGDVLRWLLGLSFLAMAAWIMVPDKMDGEPKLTDRFGPFLATLVAFFLAEIGDKTQIATVALAARFNDLVLVTCGTTLGMMLANVPAVLVGEVAATKVPLKLVRGVAASIFAVMGILVLADVGAALAIF